MTDESNTVLTNLRTAHNGDWGLDLSSQEVHKLWADIEAKEIISSCMQILSSQEVHELESATAGGAGMSEEELRPCPFCGGKNVLSTELQDGLPFIAYCQCGAENEAENWNTRPIEDELRKRIAELSQAVGLITTLKPTMVMDTEHPLDMAKEVVEYVTVRIAELVEAGQRWRVVADGELPEFGTSILFYDSILEKINKGTCTALDRDKTNLQWITDDGLYYHGNRCEYITRWMPLPELPEVK